VSVVSCVGKPLARRIERALSILPGKLVSRSQGLLVTGPSKPSDKG